jgi:MFS family permease
MPTLDQVTPTADVAAAASSRRPTRPGALLAILLTAQLMAVLDVNIVNVAAATMRTDLHASGAELQLIIAGYIIAYAVFLITGARLGGLIGYRWMFLGGLATFTAASMACGLAATAAELIAFRFVQGAGAAAMIPQVFSLIQRHFAGAARARALGRYATVIAGGLIVGQVLGGALVDADLWGSGWRPIFFINVPIGLALLGIGLRALPRDASEAGRQLDLLGLLSLAATVLAFVLPLVFGHQYGWPAWTWISLGVSALLFGGFVWTQSRAAHPLMPGRLFRAPGLVVALIGIFTMMAAYGGYSFSIALHLQSGLGYSPMRAGLTFLPMAVCFAAISLNWRRLSLRWRRYMIPTGLLMAAASLLVIANALGHGTAPGVAFYLAQIPFGMGAGAAYSPLMDRALARVAPADASDASGLVTTMVQLSQIIGLAGVGSVYLSVAASHNSGHAMAVTTLAETVVMLVATGVTLLLARPSR